MYTDEHRAYARAYAETHKQQRLEYAVEYYKTHDRTQYMKDYRLKLKLIANALKPIPVVIQQEVKPIPVVIQQEVKPPVVRPSSIGIFKSRATWMPILSTDPTKTRQTS